MPIYHIVDKDTGTPLIGMNNMPMIVGGKSVQAAINAERIKLKEEYKLQLQESHFLFKAGITPSNLEPMPFSKKSVGEVYREGIAKQREAAQQ